MSELQLNELKIHYKEFYGKNTEQMPRLIAEGRIPLSVADLMKRRLETLNSSDEVKSSWWDNHFDTGDVVVYHPNGNVKIVLDAQLLRELTPESELRNGSVILPAGMYEKLEGLEFKKNKIEKYTNRPLTEKDVNKNPFLEALARDPELLKEYSKAVFAQTKERWNYTGNDMGVYLASPQQDVPTMRLWCVEMLEYDAVIGDLDLGNHFGRLVGEVLGAQVCEKSEDSKAVASPSLEQILALGKDKAEAFGL